jgi:ABC-type glycerol-3-phosphate transport system substrate-binding protein
MGHSRANLSRLALAFAIMSLVVLSQAGCVRATPTPEPAIITFAYPTPDTEFYQQLLVEFGERYPHITVELQPKRWDMLSGISVADADVFVSSQFALNWLQDQDGLLNLTPFIEQDESFDLSDYYPGTVGLYTREGTTWAIPAGVDMMVMYYNRDLFDQARVPYPESGWTWDDLLEAAAAVRDPSTDVFGYAPDLDLFDPLTFIYQRGGRIFDDLENPTRTTFDDPLTIEALDWYTRLIFEYNVAPTPDQVGTLFGSGGVRTGIYRNMVGVWSGMLSDRGGRSWPTEWSMRWGVVQLPRDVDAATLTLVEGYYVSSTAEFPEACWTWISFVSQHIPSRQTPVRRSLAESPDYERQVGSEVAEVVRASMEGALLLSPDLAEFEEALGTFGQAFESIVAQRSTPEEAMTWAQRESKFK